MMVFAVEIPIYVDSGADVSMIPFRFGRALGLRQEREDTIQEIKGVSGAGGSLSQLHEKIANLGCFSPSLKT